MSNHEIAVRQETALDRPTDLLSIIQGVVSNPEIDVEKIRALLEMREREEKRHAEREFVAAMARLQAKLPQITKDGRIVVKGTERSRYARLEDIHSVIQPLMAEEGFSASFDEDSYGESTVTFKMIVSHAGGHSETKRKTLRHDKAAVGQYGPIRTAIQDDSSTASYARRILYTMHFNIVSKDADVDGNEIETITPDHLLDIETLIQDSKANLDKFLAHFKVSALTELLESDYAPAVALLQAKMRNAK